MFAFSFGIVTYFLASRSANAQSVIMIVGDSNGEFAGPSSALSTNSLQESCGGSTVVNKARSGSTAAEWIAGDPSLSEAFSGQYGSGYTHVWITLGANDLMDEQCSMTADTLRGRLDSVIATVRELTSPNINIVFTGYCITSVAEACPISEFATRVTSVMKTIAESDSMVTFHDIAEVCGGRLHPPTQSSPSYFVADGIHLNHAGYQKVWAEPALQTAFGCNNSLSPPESTTAPTKSPAPPPGGSSVLQKETIGNLASRISHRKHDQGTNQAFLAASMIEIQQDYVKKFPSEKSILKPDKAALGIAHEKSNSEL